MEEREVRFIYTHKKNWLRLLIFVDFSKVIDLHDARRLLEWCGQSLACVMPKCVIRDNLSNLVVYPRGNNIRRKEHRNRNKRNSV